MLGKHGREKARAKSAKGKKGKEKAGGMPTLKTMETALRTLKGGREAGGGNLHECLECRFAD